MLLFFYFLLLQSNETVNLVALQNVAVQINS